MHAHARTYEGTKLHVVAQVLDRRPSDLTINERVLVLGCEDAHGSLTRYTDVAAK